MADPVKTTDCLQYLGLTALDKEWVDVVWEQDFTEKPELPPALAQDVSEGRAYIRCLQQAIQSCVPWARIDFATLPQGFWSVLSESGLSSRALLALLHYFMCGVDKVLSSAIEREMAVLAANLYFILNEIPGSGAYRMFHPWVFHEAVDLLKQWPDPGTGKRKRNASGAAASGQSSQAGRGAKTRRIHEEHVEDASAERPTPFDLDNDEEDTEDIAVLTPQEIGRIKSAVMGALKDFVHLLRSSTLKSSEDSTEQAMQVLSELTRVSGEQGKIDTFDSTLSPSSSPSVSYIAYLGLAALCSSSHGNITEMFRLVLKHLMPNLLMLIGESETVAMATIPKTIQIIKDNAICFVCRMSSDLEDRAIPSLRILLQHLCVKVPDKAEYRTNTAQTIAHILTFMPLEHRSRFIEWLYKLTRNIKISVRSFTVEVIAVLLEQLPTYSANAPVTIPTPVTSAPTANNAPPPADTPVTPTDAVPPVPTPVDTWRQYLSPTFLAQVLLSRCSDAAPTVRAKALTCFAEFTTSTDPSLLLALKELFYPATSPTTPAQNLCSDTPGSDNHGNDQVNDGGQQVQQDGATPGNLMGGSPALVLEMTNGSFSVNVGRKNIETMLQTRVRDPKVGVRKAALQSLVNLLRLQGQTVTAEDLKVLDEACRDPALSVRKQAISSLTMLLNEQKMCLPLQKIWLQNILPGILDREESAQEKCLQSLKEILFDGIESCSRSTDDDSRLSWSLLEVLSRDDSGDLRRYLRKACQLLSSKKLLSSNVVRALTSRINQEHDQAAWLLLADVAPCSPTFDPAIIQQAWNRYKRSDLSAQPIMLQHILSTMGSLAGKFNDDVRKEMIDDLKMRLIAFNASPQLSRSLVTTLNKLCLAVDGTATRTSALAVTVGFGVLEACNSYLSKVLLEASPNQSEIVCETTLIPYLSILGEVAFLCPAQTPKRTFMLVQSLLAGPTRSEGDSIPSSQSSQSQPPLSQLSSSVFSETVRAHAFITLGKLCLLHESLARRCIPALSRELETSQSPTIRNNVAVIMCDLCVRYPSMVDRYMSNMSMCFRDKSKLVRKQSLIVITRLLLEDYVKWRGSLFFHFITSLVDDVTEIRDFVEYSLVELLLKRHPNLLHQHFVESVFHFNAYDKHNVYNQFSQADREKQMFSLKGAPNAEKRRTIYRFMLQHMTDEHRFKITAKLCQDVLAAVVDGILPLNKETNILLQDTLDILCCKEIKLTSLRAKTTSDTDDQMEMAEAVINQAKSKIISQVVKKNVIENIVPVIIALKQMLEKVHSPTLRHLMLYLKQLMKDYRNEVKDILAADRQLAAEIEFDLRRFEEEQAEAAKEAVQVATVTGRPATPTNQPATPTDTPSTPCASPRRSAGLPTVLTPRSVANCSPRIIRTPQVAPQGTSDRTAEQNEEAAIQDIAPATPIRTNRPVSLATQAIINSARKAIGTAKRCPPIKPATNQPETNQDKGPDSVAMAANERSPLKEKNVAFQNQTPPRRGLRSRAISTPDQTIANITFQAPMDLSVIPASPFLTPSPLPITESGNEQHHNGGPTNWMPQVRIEKNKDLLLMVSPDKPSPKPRVWNITSPRPATQGRGKTRINSELMEAAGGAGSEMELSSTRRRTRAHSSSMLQETKKQQTRPQRNLRSKQN